ncbi:MAG: PAS domain-containing protein [Haliscomenobacteraceae bacterium CHB4]|nr:PAS domain-containing protein [Haliscomenobacteraceae bacterium CHB4]
MSNFQCTMTSGTASIHSTAAMEPNLSSSLLQAIRHAFGQISGLPFPIYASDKTGAFLFANEQAVEFFMLDAGDDFSGFNIGTYYEDGKEREYILRQLQHVPPGGWHNNLTVRLKIHDEYRKIRFVTKPFRDEAGELCALLCIALSMSDIEWFAEFEKMMYAGFFETDKDLMLVDCNQNFAQVLNYASPAEIKGKSLGDFFWEPDKIARFYNDLNRHPHIENRQLKLRRKDGAMVVVKMSCIGIAGETENIARIKGTIHDVTFEIIQNDLPVGLFLVNTSQQGEEIISRANLTFAHIHGYDSPEEIFSKPIRQFHPNAAAYEAFKAELNKAAANNQPLLDYYMEIQDKQGKKRNVVANVRYVAEENQHLRVGAVYDVTDHVRGHTRTLEADFSSVLHTYIATINGLRDTLTMLIKAHGQDLQRDETHIDRAKAAAETVRCKKRLEELLADLSKIAEERNLDDANLARLPKLVQKLSTGDTAADKEKDNAALSRRILLEIRKCLDNLRPLNLPRELLRNLRSETDEMLRLTSMISLSISLDELNERIPDFYYFRDYLRRGEIVQQEFKSHNLVPIVLDAVRFLEEFAAIHRVNVVQQFNQRDNIPVLCHKNSLNRAFHNLLHNAIKYSWTKGQDRQPWVNVRMEKKGDVVEILIENWGVPIRREELESGSVFQFGKRGRESEDRGRSGTGIGLYDAQDVISKHGGTLRMTSEPTFGNLPEMYSNPFITRAYITLPVAK